MKTTIHKNYVGDYAELAEEQGTGLSLTVATIERGNCKTLGLDPHAVAAALSTMLRESELLKTDNAKPPF